MACSEAGNLKAVKTSSPGQDVRWQEHVNFFAYPDWASFQAYYGPNLSLPPSYIGTTITPGHAPHPYMWGPQPMMPPYGPPYAAIYQHRGVYAHPLMPMLNAFLQVSINSGVPSQNVFLMWGAQAHGNGMPSVSATTEHAVSPSSTGAPAKSSDGKDKAKAKKLKTPDGFAVSLDNGNVETASGGEASKSGSEESEMDGSNCGSMGLEGDDTNNKEDRQVKDITAGQEEIINAKLSSGDSGDELLASSKSEGITKASSGTGFSSMNSGMEFRGAGGSRAKAATENASHDVVPSNCEGLTSHRWMQDERELKREKRKQSNRESARRSRLRRQAETEQLATKVDMLNAEKLTLKSEINQMRENSQKLRQEHSVLLEKLKNAQQDGAAAATSAASNERQPPRSPTVNVEDFLSRMSGSDSKKSGKKDNMTHENTLGKLYQLLDSNPRADTVAAG